MRSSSSTLSQNLRICTNSNAAFTFTRCEPCASTHNTLGLLGLLTRVMLCCQSCNNRKRELTFWVLYTSDHNNEDAKIAMVSAVVGLFPSASSGCKSDGKQEHSHMRMQRTNSANNGDCSYSGVISKTNRLRLRHGFELAYHILASQSWPIGRTKCSEG